MEPAQQYDRGSTVFSPDGRLFQVEYAREAVKRGTTAVGLTHDDGVVLIVAKRFASDLVEPDSIQKISKLVDHAGAATSGLVADARSLVDHGRVAAQTNEVTYDEPIEVDTLVSRICSLMQAYTQYGGLRPFGASLLVGGVDDHGEHLVQADPSGASVAYDATSIGEGRDAALEVLDSDYEDGLTRQEAIQLGVRAIRQATDAQLDPHNLEIGVVSEDEDFHRLERSEVQGYLDGGSGGDAGGSDDEGGGSGGEEE